MEELEDRLGDQMQDLLDDVARSLTAPTSAAGQDIVMDGEYHYAQQQQENNVWESNEAEYNDLVLDDTGEGAGVEGDLDVDDD